MGESKWPGRTTPSGGRWTGVPPIPPTCSRSQLLGSWQTIESFIAVPFVVVPAHLPARGFCLWGGSPPTADGGRGGRGPIRPPGGSVVRSPAPRRDERRRGWGPGRAAPARARRGGGRSCRPPRLHVVGVG